MTIYRERLWASVWWFLSTALVIPGGLLIFLPINEIAGIVAAIVLYGIAVGLLLWGSPVIAVTDSEFIAGRAHLPLAVIGEVRGYSGDAATLERGQHLDARAWLLIRGWIGSVVTIELLDPEDPAPYWLVSTRHPEKVIDAIVAARAAATA